MREETTRFESARARLPLGLLTLATLVFSAPLLAVGADAHSSDPEAPRIAMTTQHLATASEARALVEARGGIAQVAEVRIGGIGHWELGVRPDLTLLGGPGTMANFDGWINGTAERFLLTSDGESRYQLTLGSGSRAVTVQSPFGDTLASPREILVVAASELAPATVRFTRLTLNGVAIDDQLAVGGAGALQDVLRLYGPELPSGFQLSGEVTFAWSGLRPRGTALQLQLWLVDLAVPPASAVAYSAGTTLTGLGLPEGRLRFDRPETVRALGTDPVSGHLWTLTGTVLERRTPEGEVELRTSTGLPPAGAAHLLSHFLDGSVWVGAGSRVEAYGLDGQRFASLELSAPLHGLSHSPDDALLWVTTQESAASYDAVAGELVRELEVPKGTTVGCLVVDPGNGGLWISFGSELRHYSETGDLEAAKAMPYAVALAPDGQHGAWMAIEERLEHIDSQLSTTQVLSPWRTHEERIGSLTLLPDARTLLVSGDTLTVQMSTTGTLLSQTAFSPALDRPVWYALSLLAP
jgi:hypothetical protein